MPAMAQDQDYAETGDSSDEWEAFDGFGHVPGVLEGEIFKSRAELAERLVHRPLQAGICGTRDRGAESIVLSGGYEDDYDGIDEIIYTGHGGQDGRGRQIKDQEPTTQNESLKTSWINGKPVRVIRAINARRSGGGKVEHGGFRYDGLYFVDHFWAERGRSSHLIFRSRLIKASVGSDDHDSAGDPREELVAAGPSGRAEPARRLVSTQRIIRTTQIAEWVKRIYDYTCQVCGVRLSVGDSAYAEAAHIRPLGRPHDGPDEMDNVLCLCPNDHVLFDRGGIEISDDLVVTYIGASKEAVPLLVKHAIKREHLRYHREYYQKLREEFSR